MQITLVDVTGSAFVFDPAESKYFNSPPKTKEEAVRKMDELISAGLLIAVRPTRDRKREWFLNTRTISTLIITDL